MRLAIVIGLTLLFKSGWLHAQAVTDVQEFSALIENHPGERFTAEVVVSVNHWDPDWKALYIQQDETGWFASLTPELLSSGLNLELGDRIRIFGYLDTDNSILKAESIERVGAADPVTALALEMEMIALGNYWSRRIETTATVDSIICRSGTTQIVARSGKRRFLVRSLRDIDPTRQPWLGAEIKLRGTLSYLVDPKGRPNIAIVHGMPGDLFEIVTPGETLSEDIPRYDPLEALSASVDDQLYVFDGQIGFIDEYNLMVLEEAATEKSIPMHLSVETDIRVSDRVRVYAVRDAGQSAEDLRSSQALVPEEGFAESDWIAKAVFRQHSSVLQERMLTAEEIVEGAIEGVRATVEADLLAVESQAGEKYCLRLQSDGIEFSAYVSALDRRELYELEQANRIQITGLVQGSSEPSLEAFSLVVAKPAAIEVLSRKAFALERYSLYGLIGAILLLIGGAVLVLRLRGQVDRKSQDIQALAAQLNSTYDAIREALVVVSRNGEVIATNRRVEDVLGTAQHSLRRFSKPMPGNSEAVAEYLSYCFDEPSKFMRAWRKAQRTPDTVVQVDLELSGNADGNAKPMVSIYSAAIEQPKGNDVIGPRIWTFTDISEQKRLERDLLQSQKMEAVGRLAGGIAHDFNNLLLAIDANIELARLEGETSGRSESAHLDAAESAVSRATKLVKHLLGFSRKSRLEMQVRNPNRVVGRVQNLLERTLDSRITLEVEKSDSLRNASLDDTHIEQVLLNLCLNARDACSANGGKIRIVTRNLSGLDLANEISLGRISASPDQAWVAIAVEDNGPGMSEEVQRRIFDPFFTTKELGKGTGLGLSVSLGIVEQHGGTIRVHSQPEQGSVFEVVLPATEDRSHDSDSQIRRLPPSRGGSGIVLLADDDEMVRRATASGLRALGYEVNEVDNGVDALICLRSQQPVDLAILDLSMPGMSGAEVHTAVRDSNQTLPIIISSGYVQELDAFESLDAPTAVISKPYRLSRLTALIDSFMSQGEAAKTVSEEAS
ncbi:MAG: ATP-binding protein [Aureliella sp.]